MLKKNDVIHLNITSATAEGSGVGKPGTAWLSLCRFPQSATGWRCGF